MTTRVVQAHELETFDAEPSLAESSRRENASALAPADSGWQAWLFLFASFLVEMLLWGEYGWLLRRCSSLFQRRGDLNPGAYA